MSYVRLFCTMLLVALMFFSEAVPRNYERPRDAHDHVDLENLTVYHIGSSNIILDKVLDKLQRLGVAQIEHLETQEFFSNDASTLISPNRESLVIFDGDWISGQVDDLGIHRFLREASYKRAQLIAIGGSTSKFLEALDKAGINELGRNEDGNVRNPVYFNPPLVGFKLKQAGTPDGHPYSYPSMFSSNTENVDAMVQALINWLGG